MAYKFQVGPFQTDGEVTLEGQLTTQALFELANGMSASALESGSTPASGEWLLFRASDSSVKAADRDQFFADAAGDGIGADSGVLNVNAGTSLEISGDDIGVQNSGITEQQMSSSVAGNGLSGLDGSPLNVNIGTSLEISGNNVQVANSGIDIDQINSNVAGDGLTGGDGSQLQVNVDGSTLEIDGDSLRVANNGINNNQLNSDVAGTGLSGGGGNALALDFTELSDQGSFIDVENDWLPFILNISGSSDKVTIQNFATAIADGTTITANNGVLSVAGVQNIDVTSHSSGSLTASLSAGFNRMAENATQAPTMWQLPVGESASVGDIVYVKAPNDLNNGDIIIDTQGSDNIDNGTDQVEILSGDASVGFVYTGDNTWMMF